MTDRERRIADLQEMFGRAEARLQKAKEEGRLEEVLEKARKFVEEGQRRNRNLIVYLEKAKAP